MSSTIASSANTTSNIKESETQLERKAHSELKIIMKKKTPAHVKSVSTEDQAELASSDSSQDSLLDECIFPSPVAISEEEAMRETQCHYVRPNYRDTINTGGTCDEGSEDGRYSVYMNSRQPIRREIEKPPRLQKQMSRDRLPSVNRQAVGTETGQSNGDAYSQASSTECLDSTGVDVHEFLVKALQSNPRDRNILLKLERDMIKFCKSNENAFMRFPEMTSYHRMLVHRVAAYFGMDHNIDAKGNSVIINKTENTRIPEKKFRDYIAAAEDQGSGRDEDGRRSILKRMKNCQSLDHGDMQVNRNSNWKESRQRSFEEREDHYERTRARIFQEHPRNERFRYKDRMMTQWKSRPWNSTDLECMPERRVPTVSPLGTSAHMNKANTSMTILSRHTKINKESISSSSSSSSLFQPQQNDANTPDVNNDQDHHQLNMQSSSTHPSLSGVPYVNMETQPIYPHQAPLMLPSYNAAPMCYAPNPVLPQDVRRMAPPADISGTLQNGMVQPEGLMMNPHPAVYPPAGPIIYPYQSFPLPMYYPFPPMQEPAPVHTNHVNGRHDAVILQAGVAKMKLDDAGHADRCAPPNVDGVATSSEDSTDAPPLLPTNHDEEAMLRDQDDCAASQSSSFQSIENVGENDSPAFAVSTVDSTASNDSKLSVDSKDNQASVDGDVNHEQAASQLETSNQANCVSTTVSTGLGSITYYTVDKSGAPIQSGSSGAPIFAPSPAYPATMLPYPFNGMPTDGKPFHPVPGQPAADYYLPANYPATPGYGSFVPGYHPPPALYYMLNNQRMGQFQNMPPVFYSAAPPNGYPAPPVPQATAFAHPQPPTGSDSVAAENNARVTDEASCVNRSGAELSPFPMSLCGDVSDMNDPKVIALATRFKARIVQLSDADDQETSSKDVFLLFPSSRVAAQARIEAESDGSVQLSEVVDKEQLDVLMQNDVVRSV